MIIRSAKESDLPACIDIFHIPELRFPHGDYADVREMRPYLDERYFLVAEEDNQIVGCVYGERTKANGFLLWLFAVKKEMRGSGIGQKLYETLEKNCKKEGIEWIISYTPYENKGSSNFYSKQQFAVGETFYECLKYL